MVDTRVKTTEGECLSPSTKAAQRRKHGQAQAGTPLPCCCPPLHAQGGHTNCPQRPAPTAPAQPSAFVCQIPSSITCLGGHLSGHGSFTSSTTVRLCLLQPCTCSLPPSFIPEVVRTSPSVDHSLSIITQMTGWKWLSVAWGTPKASDCTAHQESCWRVDCSTGEAARSIQNMSEESTLGQEGERRCQCKSWKKTKTVWVLVAQIPWE